MLNPTPLQLREAQLSAWELAGQSAWKTMIHPSLVCPNGFPVPAATHPCVGPGKGHPGGG